MNFALYTARKIYNDKGDKRQVSRPAIRIATAGVAIGLAVMILSASVVMGFKHTIRDKVIGFGCNITVTNFLALQDDSHCPVSMNDSIIDVLKNIDGVKHVQRYAMKQGILKTQNDFMGVMFKGVAEDYDTTFIHNNLVEGIVPKFSSESGSNKILISKTTADNLGLKLGDKVFAYFIDGNDVRARRFDVAGIYQTNLAKFDKVICFCDLYTSVKLNGWEKDQASGAEITLENYDRLETVEKSIVKKINRTTDKYGETYSSETVEQMNPQIFTWLDLLDLNVWIILALMVCVAGITMISGLLIIILERTNMIGIMKALGTRNKTIRHTFLWFAVFIIGRGMLWGNIMGTGLIALQHFTGIVTLDPTTYYVNTVPVEFDFIIIAAINIATLIVCVVALIAPSYLVSFIHPAKSMRYE
ncbi:ABC transporter permease [Prevotella sp. OH937_COT-195]|uniref:ABC transporter permease n=1 Tax=Prevotella sp. OH937_COT-195 TaxID=2491051 RepID=UPI000F64C704|nr:ABC transporter permease [Prevotella sp. OH937_COT-195]RRD02886.1 ABC transporter permease [Prevotella sp. OH937_COT-195]